MKKILFAIAIFLTLGMAANAQGKNDSFFSSDWGNNGYNRGISNGVFPAILGGTLGNLEGDQPAPLGSGLLILTALGAGYAVSRRRNK